LTGGSRQLIDQEGLRRALEAMPDVHKPRSGSSNGGSHNYSGGSTDRDEIIARLPGYITDLVEMKETAPDIASGR
jgi:hypothetical protein